MTRLVDMHMHAGFTGNPARFARELGDNGIDVFANTVTPQEFKRLFPLLHGESSMRLGLGLHPWWIGSSELGPLDEVLAVFEHELQSTRFVGEIGLDLWPSHAFTKDFQIEALVRIAKLCAMRGGYPHLFACGQGRARAARHSRGFRLLAELHLHSAFVWRPVRSTHASCRGWLPLLRRHAHALDKARS